ncbi:hypothetical protein WBK31_34590 [Nonomuraea sp. N2-4H]
MSPEQVTALPVGPAADVFSLGCVLAYAATGRSPFGEGPPWAITHRIVYEEPDLSGVPEPLVKLIASCLEKNPDARPELDHVLEVCRPLSPKTSSPPEGPTPPGKPGPGGPGGPDHPGEPGRARRRPRADAARDPRRVPVPRKPIPRSAAGERCSRWAPPSGSPRCSPVRARTASACTTCAAAAVSGPCPGTPPRSRTWLSAVTASCWPARAGTGPSGCGTPPRENTSRR